jgi:hypothetical protein
MKRILMQIRTKQPHFVTKFPGSHEMVYKRGGWQGFECNGGCVVPNDVWHRPHTIHSLCYTRRFNFVEATRAKAGDGVHKLVRCAKSPVHVPRFSPVRVHNWNQTDGRSGSCLDAFMRKYTQQMPSLDLGHTASGGHGEMFGLKRVRACVKRLSP